MKKFVRKLLAAIIITSMIVPMTNVMAVSTDKKNANPSTTKSTAELQTQKRAQAQSQVEQKTTERKQQNVALKAEIKSKKDTIKANNTQLQSIRKEIVAKKNSIHTILNALTASNKVIPSDLLDAIKAQSAILKADLQAVNSGKGTLDTASKDVAAQVKAKNSDGVVKGLDNVIAKQTARINALNKLNSDLAIMLQLAQKAQSLATDPVASTPADTTSSANSVPADTASSASTVSSESSVSSAV